MLFKEANEQMHHANRLVNSPVADNLGEGELGWCAHTAWSAFLFQLCWKSFFARVIYFPEGSWNVCPSLKPSYLSWIAQKKKKTKAYDPSILLSNKKCNVGISSYPSFRHQKREPSLDRSSSNQLQYIVRESKLCREKQGWIPVFKQKLYSKILEKPALRRNR